MTVAAGDVVAFLGASTASRLYSGGSGVSHIGIIVHGGPFPVIAESTVSRMRNGKASGVYVSLLEHRIEDYRGSVWILPLRDPIDEDALRMFVRGSMGARFDLLGGLGIVLGNWSRCMGITRTQGARLYSCSVFVTAALVESGALPAIPDTPLSPADVCAQELYRDEYLQVKGEPRKLARFNGGHHVRL